MKTTLYDVAGSGGAYLSVPATQPTRRVEIVEDDAVANQGLTYQLPGDSFTQTFTAANAREPIVLGSLPNNNGRGAVLGLPIQKTIDGGTTLRAADILIKLRSKTATATKVRVTEFD